VYKMVECVMFICFFCNDSFSMCHGATLTYCLGLSLEMHGLGLEASGLGLGLMTCGLCLGKRSCLHHCKLSAFFYIGFQISHNRHTMALYCNDLIYKGGTQSARCVDDIM